MVKQFQGVINLDIRGSTPGWSPFVAEQAPVGSPNVLVILDDDTGVAAWSPPWWPRDRRGPRPAISR